MKVYVENKYIPEKCSKCNFIGYYEDGGYKRNPHCCCELYWDLHQDEIRVNKNSRDERCPLQPLSDYTKQVRKEVCTRIEQIISKYLYKRNLWKEEHDISSMIKQIQGESNET